MNILITGIGGPTPRSLARTLRNHSKVKRIIGVDVNAKAIGFHMNGLLDLHYVVPRATSENYWDEILRIRDAEKIEYAFVQPEIEVIEWGKYFEVHGSYPIPTLIPPLEISRSLINKAIMSEVLADTDFIPKTIKINQENPDYEMVEDSIGFPCWIRATQGSGGLGSLKVENLSSLRSWLFIHRDIPEFTVSEYLPGRHLANQMLFYNGKYISGASLECVEYVMASVAPSRVTGNTSYGRLLNEHSILDFSIDCIDHISNKLDVKPHGVLSFDLKEDKDGNYKVTEINIRHMAYTGILADAGFDLVKDSIDLHRSGDKAIHQRGHYEFNKDYAFLRDVDIEPILIDDKILNV